MNSIFPWQQDKWQYLTKRISASQLPHAILLQGREGLGKMHFATCLADLLLCQKSTNTEEACGECASCQLLQANNHPDLVIIKPDDKGKTIKIDQIRDLIVSLNNTSHQGGYKVVIIESAELLNIAASNALLKTLEEPNSDTVIILVTAHPMSLSATIRSRCQMLSMSAPEYEVARRWLESQVFGKDVELLLSLTENAPLKALTLAQEEGLQERQEIFDLFDSLYRGKITAVKMASSCSNFGLDNLLMLLLYVTNDLIKLQFDSNETVVNKDQVEKLAGFAEKTDLNKLFAYKDKLTELRQYLVRKINLNQQLVMENLLIDWVELFE